MKSTYKFRKYLYPILFILSFLIISDLGFAQNKKDFNVIAFYTAQNDKAHISFVNEANQWFEKISEQHHFNYNSTKDWNKLNTSFLSDYDLVIFLDTRPDSIPQREAFQNYMENGGSWMGFHFCAFALTPSTYPQNWDWYHTVFLGSGEYKSNTWRPTTAILKVENNTHSATIELPEKFESSVNEWYCWENDLRKNTDIKILASVDSSSFPLGTGPKQNEIWRSGDYPVVWTNINYRMIYINMGHNDIDYESGTNNELSHSFQNKQQNILIIESLKWLGKNSTE